MTAYCGTAGTACQQYAFFLGINVQHPACLDLRQINGCRTQHADFLIGGQHNLQRRMGNGRVCQNRQGIGNRDAVITAQCGALCPDPFSICPQIQSLLLQVKRAIRFLFTDHIQMPLQHDRLRLLHARSPRCKQNDIVAVILPVIQTMLLCKTDAKITDRFCIAGAVGNPAQLFKHFKYA